MDSITTDSWDGGKNPFEASQLVGCTAISFSSSCLSRGVCDGAATGIHGHILECARPNLGVLQNVLIKFFRLLPSLHSSNVSTPSGTIVIFSRA